MSSANTIAEQLKAVHPAESDTDTLPSPSSDELIAGHARAMKQTLGYTGVCKCCGESLTVHAHRVPGVSVARGTHEVYYGSTSRDNPNLPHGPGVVIDSTTGLIVRRLGGMWEEGKLIKQTQVWRGSLPPETPLPRKGTVDENTLAHGVGILHLVDGVAFTGGTWDRGVLQYGFIITNQPGRRGRYDGPFVRDSPDSYSSSPFGIGAIQFPDFCEIYLGAVDGRGRNSFGDWQHGFGVVLATDGHDRHKAGQLLAAGEFQRGKLTVARGVRPSDLPRSDQPGGDAISPLARQATLIWHADGLYTGELDRDGYASGKGVHTHADGKPFGEGMFWRNALHGVAGRSWPDGASYRGEYAVGLKHGRGCYEQPDGSGYDGEWENDKPCGFGMSWTAHGTISFIRRHSPDDDAEDAAVPRRFLFHCNDNKRLSLGQLKADLLYPSGGWYIGALDSRFRQHGHGSSYDKHGSLVAEGEWIQGKLAFNDSAGAACKLDHLGVLRVIADVKPCEDDIENPLSFLSTFHWPDGRYFEGRVTFLRRRGDDADAAPVLLPHGLGACWSSKGELIVVGLWQGGQPVSEGPIPCSYCIDSRFLTPDQKAATLLLPGGGYYTGQYHPLTRVPHGPTGRAVEADGVVSDGAWVDGQLHGRATQTFPGGNFRYDGDWMHGDRSGLGTSVLDGVTWSGQMANHCQVGYGAQWDANRQITACGRWMQDDPDTPAVLVDSCPVPLQFLPERRFLPAYDEAEAHGRGVRLYLCPDGTIKEQNHGEEKEEGEGEISELREEKQ